MPAKFILSSAGSGKTDSLFLEAIRRHPDRTLLLTYTEANTRELETRVWNYQAGKVGHISVMTWFQFLMNHCILPYFSSISDAPISGTYNFESPPPKVRRAEISKYHLDAKYNVFSERSSDLAILIDDSTDGLVVNRLTRVFSTILIDEFQDLAGYDLELLKRLGMSTIDIVAAGDPRQATFTTNRSNRNRNYRRAGITQWVTDNGSAFEVSESNTSHRCVESICNFASGLYPEMAAMISGNSTNSNHQGVFTLTEADLSRYVDEFSPQGLRYNRTVNTMDIPARNFGEVKGQTFDRVLIFPTKPMLNYLSTADPSKAGDRSKFYIAVTRARFSVAFLVPDDFPDIKVVPRWKPNSIS